MHLDLGFMPSTLTHCWTTLTLSTRNVMTLKYTTKVWIVMAGEELVAVKLPVMVA